MTGVLRRLRHWYRARKLASVAWCAYCGQTPARRFDRYCCDEHRDADRDEDWSIR